MEKYQKKRGETYYSYKDHINIDAKHKLMHKYVVTPANTPDIKYVEELLDKKTLAKMYAEIKHVEEKIGLMNVTYNLC